MKLLTKLALAREALHALPLPTTTLSGFYRDCGWCVFESPERRMHACDPCVALGSPEYHTLEPDLGGRKVSCRA